MLSSAPGLHRVVWDLRYFDTHIAGNAEYQMARLKESMGAQMREAEVRTWAERVLGGTDEAPARADGPASIDPSVIAAWGGAGAAEAKGP